MSDKQQATIALDGVQRIQRLRGVEVSGQRRMHPQPSLKSCAPLLGGELRSLSGTRLGAEQHGVEVDAEPPQGQARGARLGFPALGQPAIGIRARAMRLRLGVT